MGSVFAAALLSAALCAATIAHAEEKLAIGAPVTKENIEIAATYLNGVVLDKSPSVAGPDSVYLQADIHAAKDEPHGFAQGAWIPYLTIAFALTKEGAPTYKKGGFLYPAAAKDGPQYGGPADLSGPGTYHLSYIISPPTSHGLLRHVDKVSGVPEWWKPITASWTFTYPDKSQ